MLEASQSIVHPFEVEYIIYRFLDFSYIRMASKLSYTAVLALLLNHVSGHIKMAQPVPFSADKVDTSPIKAADFPCKQTLGYEISQMNEMAAGSTQSITFDGTAVHGGGSCQLAVTLDKEPTAASTFKVIHSIMGGCPGVDGGTETFDFTLPSDIPNGEATFAWTWFARLSGQPEMYMNCAPITITGGADDTSSFEQLPDLFVANIETSQCKSPESKDLLFPNPGQSVVESPGASLEAPTGSDCGASGGGGGGPGTTPGEGGTVDGGSPDNGSPGTGAPNPGIPGNGSPGAGEKNPGIPDPAAPNPGIPSPEAPSDGAPSDGSAGDDGNGIEIIPTQPDLIVPPAETQSSGISQSIAKPSASAKPPSQSSAAATPSTLLTVTTSSSIADRPSLQQPTGAKPIAPPAPSFTSGSSIGNGNGSGAGTGDTSGTCAGDGTMMCNGPSQFGLCNNGNVVYQQVAPGTRCQGGVIVKRGLEELDSE